MKTLNSVKNIFLGLGLLSLAACSSMGSNSNGGYSSGQQRALTTTGLGADYGVQPIGVPNSILLAAPHNQSYYFDFNKSIVKPQYKASINAQANYLVRHPRARILVAGNTDARGSHEYNMALGERRALAVVRILKMQGVSKNQIRYISYGDMRPIALGHSAPAYAKNRRVDLTYEKK